MSETSDSILPVVLSNDAQGGTALVDQKLARLSSLVDKMAEMLLVMDARAKTMESALRQRVTVSSMQAKSISNAVRRHAMHLCEKYELDYKAVGQHVRGAIWKDFREAYSVASPYDLPAMYHDNAISFICEWSSFSLIQKIRKKGDKR